MSAAGNTSHVTRLELTADQLLGPRPARPHKRSKNTPKLITLEDLLGPGLTIAGPSRSSSRIPPTSILPSSVARPSVPRAPSATSYSPPHVQLSETSRQNRLPETGGLATTVVGTPQLTVRCRSSTPSLRPRSPMSPNQVRVTADEVLRTGIPFRSLQVAKARVINSQATGRPVDQPVPSGSTNNSESQARELTADQLFASQTGINGSGSRLLPPRSVRNLPRVLTADELAGGSVPARRPRSAAGNVNQSSSPTASPSIPSSRITRPSSAENALGGRVHARSHHHASSSSRPARPRAPRSGHVQRSSSRGSTRTLPKYTKEPGESEVVIDRGAEELEDEAPTNLMTPVAVEDVPSFPYTDPIPTSPTSPEADNGQHTALNGSSSSPISPSAASFEPHASYPVDEAPSYETAMMSSPDLSPLAADISVPASPALSDICDAGAHSPTSPARYGSQLDVSNPSSPSDGAESPRRRFQFLQVSLFQNGRSSRSRTRTQSMSPTPERLSPEPLHSSPRPLHRSSHSASASVLDLLSRSWSDNNTSSSRADRSGA